MTGHPIRHLPPSSRRGAVLLLVAAGMTLFCGVAALVIDIGRVYVQQTKLQEAAEAAAIGGGQELAKVIRSGLEVGTAEEARVRAAAIRVAGANGIVLQESDVIVTGDRVYVNKPEVVDYTFAKVLGFEAKEVAGTAVAKVNADGTTGLTTAIRYNVMPWAMAHGYVAEPYTVLSRDVNFTPQPTLEPGREYILKLGGGPLAGGLYYPSGTQVLIPMAGAEGAWDQWNIGFKRAYGLAYWLAGQNIPVKWLLGYRGGAFMFDFDAEMMRQLGAMRTAGAGEFGTSGVFVDPDYFQWVKYEIVEDATAIIQQTTAMIVIDRAPRVGVYSSNEDAVTRTMNDAGIPYTLFGENEIIAGCLANYDWLHIHHEDFTGQGGDGGLAVPTLVSVTDKTGVTTEGPAGGTIWIKGSGFLSYRNGHRNIRLYLGDTPLRLADTSTYSTDFLSADNWEVNATDTGAFEVTAVVPTLPNGRYTVYAQVRDEYSNYLSYTITGSTINPRITAADGAGDPLDGPPGAPILVEGGSFGPSTPRITLRFAGTNLPVESTTARYPDDAVSGGFITSSPAGSWEVQLNVPDWLDDGTYEIQAILERATSNVVLYHVNTYRHPVIELADEHGDPLRGPAGESVTVTGRGFRPGQTGITLRFADSILTVSDTALYSGDMVVGASDITADAAGRFQVAFFAPALPAGMKACRSEHTDLVNGQPIGSPAVLYDLQDTSALAPEIYLEDADGGELTAWPGARLYVEGLYFSGFRTGIRLYLTSPEERPLQLTDAAGYSGDFVHPDGLRVDADLAGRFRIAFDLPADLAAGTWEVRARYDSLSRQTDPRPVVISGRPPELTLLDQTEPQGSGLAGSALYVYGQYFTPDAEGLRLTFAGETVTPYDTAVYSGDGVSGGLIRADGDGRFCVSFWLPVRPPGTYKVRVAGSAPDITREYDYAIEVTNDFQTARNAAFDPEADAFTVADTLHLRAFSNDVDYNRMVRAQATLVCAYHGTHTVTINLNNNGDYSHTGSIAWSAVPGVHNGDWNVAFRLEDVEGHLFEPETAVHVSGTANVTESSLVSRTADYSDALPMLSNNERVYFKIQSPNVDYSDMAGGTETARVLCTTNYTASGLTAPEHNSGLLPLTNGWNGIWTGSLLCTPSAQHVGNHKVHLKITDAAGRNFETLTDVCFFTASNQGTLLSENENFDTQNTNFYKHGMLHFRVFKRGMNHLNMSFTRYRYRRYYGSRSNYSPSSGYYSFTNEGNGMFRISESLSGYQNRSDYTKFRLYYGLSDNAGVSLGNVSNTYVEFTLRSTVSSNPFAEAWKVAEGRAAGAARYLAAAAGRALGALSVGDRFDGTTHFECRDGGYYVDGRRHELSPGPAGVPAAPAEAAARAPFAWMAAGCRCGELSALAARYAETRGDGETWWAGERPAPDERVAAGTAEAEPGLRAWFASPARAAVYRGKYDLVHAIRNWVVNGGYMFAMCYGSETMDMTLAKDANGNLIGYTNTFAFKDFGANRINVDDTANFTLPDMSNSGDEFARPLAIVQDHVTTLEGFTGSTTAYKRLYVKTTTGPNNSPVHLCGVINADRVKYLGAAYGDGWFTYLGGHDPRLTSVYRLILDNILIGSLATTVPTSTMANYVVLDMDNRDDGEATDRSQYAQNVKYGYPPALIGDITTTYPGDLPGDPLVDTLPFNLAEETAAGIDHMAAHDMDRAEPGEVHTWRTPEAGSSRYVLVPICSVYKSDGTLTCEKPQNLTAPLPEHVYDVLGRDKVRILRYGLFYLSTRSGVASGDPDLAETGSLRDGEVRGKFIGYLK